MTGQQDAIYLLYYLYVINELLLNHRSQANRPKIDSIYVCDHPVQPEVPKMCVG